VPPVAAEVLLVLEPLLVAPVVLEPPLPVALVLVAAVVDVPALPLAPPVAVLSSPLHEANAKNA
jgi:hypothetical protein